LQRVYRRASWRARALERGRVRASRPGAIATVWRVLCVCVFVKAAPQRRGAGSAARREAVLRDDT